MRTGRPRTSKDVTFNCPGCDRQVTVPDWEIKQGRKFCSHDCYAKNRVGQSSTWNIKEPDKKICPKCGVEFLVGGGGRPHRYQEHCSKSCLNKMRGHIGKYKGMSETDKAYLAGFIDGEGTIMLINTSSTGRNYPNLRLTAANTHHGVLTWILETTGLGSIITKHSENIEHNTGYTWQCNSWGALDVIKDMLPYLKVKRDQALLVIEYADKWFDGKCTIEEGRAYYERSKALNARGLAKKILTGTGFFD